MRILVIPEVYRRDDLTCNGTVNDMVAWVDHWLDHDPTLHVYWLLPPRDAVGYRADDVGAAHERVTLIEADTPMADTEYSSLFTENGYSADQLVAIREHIFDAGAYLDVVIDQLRTGRFTLYKWLLDHVDQWAATVPPFDIIANVHDLQVPFKYRGCSYRNAYQMSMELSAAAFADGIWFTADVDAKDFRDHATRFFKREIVDEAFDRSIIAGSPIVFDRFEETYRDTPETVHLAGSLLQKKRVDVLTKVAGILYDRFGIETVMTSMDTIPEAFKQVEWIDTYPKASRGCYERMLEKGDIAICASQYETMARTPFEQAASGQVLILRDQPWIDDCVPNDYPFVGDLADLADLAIEAVEGWDGAVAASENLLTHIKEIRGPVQCGRRTYEDLRRRVAEKCEQYIECPSNEGAKGALNDIVAGVLSDIGDSHVSLDQVIKRTGQFTADGQPLTTQSDYALIDVVYTLRSLGYADTGEPGTPIFRPQPLP